MSKELICSMSFVLVLAVTGTASAYQRDIAVPDAGFEDHGLAQGGYIDVADGSYTGAWKCHSGNAWIDYGYWAAEGYPEDLPARSGNNKAYAYSDYIYQILDETFIEGGTYTLRVWVGQPWAGYASGWRLYFAGENYTNNLIEASGTAGLSWEQISLVYTATAADAGKKIGIKMWSDEEVSFDDVTLTVGGDPRWAHDPTPEDGETGVPVAGATLSWKAGVDPGDPNIPNPNVIKHYLWLSAPYPVGTTTFPDLWWNQPGAQQFTISADADNDGAVDASVSKIINGLQKNKLYLWFVDEGLVGSSGPTETDPTKIKWGSLWRFETELFDAPPVVDAGDDMITWSGEPVQLDPNIVDDGASPLTYLWSADPDVGVAFNPSEFVEAPTVTITDPPITVTRTIQAEDDDVEEYLNTEAIHGWAGYPQGGMVLASNDLEVGDDGGDGLFWQVVAVQYDQLGIPQGSTITSAKLTFQAAEDGEPYSSNDFTILAEAADDAAAFSSNPFDVTARARSAASVGWNPPTSAAVGEKVDTPDISALVQEVVDRPGWSDNNRLTLMIYPDVYLALPDPATGGNTTVTSHTYQAGPGADSATLMVRFQSPSSAPASSDPIIVTLTLAVNDVVNPTPVVDTMTIDVYDDACVAARIGKALAAENPGDLDGNCITDFDDLAVMATTWLDDYALTEPIAK